MAKFTKYNNPNRKRRPRRKLDYTDRSILAGKAMLMDRELGYELPIEYYEKAYRLKGDEQ